MTDREDNSQDVWSFIHISEFACPPVVRTEAAARGIAGIFELVRSKTREPVSLIAGADLKPAGQKLLKRLLPQIPVDQAAAALDKSLEGWMKAGQAGPNGLFVVGAPFTKSSGIVAKWANLHGYKLVDPPQAEDIIKGDEKILSVLDTLDKPVVFTRLEKWFLRQTEGLDIIRKLIDRLQTVSTSYIVQCDSWAWAYLSIVLEINQLYPEPLVLEPLDHKKLEQWFGNPGTGNAGPGYIFRQSNNGSYVINPSVSGKSNADDKDKDVAATDFLKHLAAYSRGNPGTARAIWEHNLQALPDEDADDSMVEEARSQAGRVIWVKPWSQDNCPYLANREKINLLVLHALLLHGGLTVDVLNYLLPSPVHQIQKALHQLAIAGLVRDEEGTYSVAPDGYPSVRQTLYGEGYMVDGL